MEAQDNPLRSLLDSTEDYIRTSVELLKLKTIDKATDKISDVISRTIAIFVFIMFLILVSIAVGFLLGSILDNTWLGFFIVAGFYGLMGIILFFFTHNWFKKVISNVIIKNTFK
jgi:fatty acid desaturase